MRKEQLDNWVKTGGDLPEDLTEDEKSYLEGLGWSFEEEWHENGKKRLEYHYLHGKLHGKWEEWWENGKKRAECHCLHGEKHGKCEGGWNDGQKGYEFHYFHGKEHGTCKVWKGDETLFVHKEYAYGVLLKDFLKQTS